MNTAEVFRYMTHNILCDFTLSSFWCLNIFIIKVRKCETFRTCFFVKYSYKRAHEIVNWICKCSANIWAWHVPFALIIACHDEYETSFQLFEFDMTLFMNVFLEIDFFENLFQILAKWQIWPFVFISNC